MNDAAPELPAEPLPPPPPDLDSPPQPPPAQLAQPVYDPVTIEQAGQQLGDMVVMGLAIGFRMGGLRQLDDSESGQLKASAIRYARARPRLVVGGTRFVPELDFFGSILALAVLRALEAPPPPKPEPEKTDEESPIPPAGSA